jgi:hypothetical protein
VPRLNRTNNLAGFSSLREIDVDDCT